MILNFDFTDDELYDILTGLDALTDDCNSELSFQNSIYDGDQDLVESLTASIARVSDLYKRIQTRMRFMKGVKTCT